MVMASRGFADEAPEEVLEEAELAVQWNGEHHQRTRFGQGDMTAPPTILALVDQVQDV